ncbi:MAG: DNA replication/repair protein RecF [Anaerolineae bacterium]|jgi:DNA replication and repair protein RecF|nr:DNA replication/repair protein RecF [Anaerolineae bacterium]
MRIRSLSLRQFRTYNRLELDLPAGPILLLGANAQGKTSLLEAIAFLAIGASPLTSVDQQVIHWGAEEASLPFSHVRAEVVRRDCTETLEVAIERKPLSNGHQRMQKSVRIDQRPIRRSNLAGHLNVVLFLPEDLALVHGPPVGRRAYLDNLLSQVYPTYVEVYDAYRHAVSRRNALLRHLRRHGGDPMQLAPLEERIVRTGVTVSLYRQQVIRELTIHIDRLHRELTGGQAWLRLQYEPNFDPVRPPAADQMGLLPEDAEERTLDVEALYTAYREALARKRAQEIDRGMTLVGPHRDEMRFISNERDMGTFGSRGQQRTSVLALHLAELRWLEQTTGESPVLLLDEVLAELDRARRNYLLDLLGNVEQTILATTDAELFPDSFRKRTTTLRVSEGIIIPVETP